MSIPHNSDFHHGLLRGRHHLSRLTGTALEKGLECFTRALALEPEHARARAGIAQVRATQCVLSLARPRDVMPEAQEEALKTIEIDDAVADAHFALALVSEWYEWDWA